MGRGLAPGVGADAGVGVVGEGMGIVLGVGSIVGVGGRGGAVQLSAIIRATPNTIKRPNFISAPPHPTSD